MRIFSALVLALTACTSPNSTGRDAPPEKAVSASATDAPAPPKRSAKPASQAAANPADVCADCHPDEVERFAKTGMGHSLYRPSARPVIENFDPIKATIRHPEMPALYRAYVDADGVWWQEETIPDAPAYRRRVRVDYIIGSGNHTRSYLGTVDGELVQLPLTWYSQKRKWDLSPGYEGAGHLRFWRPVGPECLFCHNGLTPHDERYASKYTAPLAEGISCDRCHGDSRRHVAARTQGAPLDDLTQEIFNPAKQSPARAAEVCQQCHLQGEARMLLPGQRWDAYDVGQPLSTHHTAFVAENAAIGSSIAGHGARLARSKCRQANGQALRCTTCHDPHGAAVTRSVETVCVGCHSDAPQKHPREVDLTGRCVTCHMATTGTTDIPHVRITDHFIQRRPREQLPTPSTASLVPARPLPPTVRLDVALGQALIKSGHLRDPQRVEAGVARLAGALAKAPGTAAAWTALGAGYLSLGQDQAALTAFEKALALDPEAVLSREEHAYAAAGAGQLDTAIASLRIAIAKRPDFAVGLGLLGNLLCRTERCAEALPFLARAARAAPSDSTLAFNHAAALLRLGRADAAMDAFRHTMTLDPLNHQAAVEWAQLAMAKGQYAAAIKALTVATKCAPTAPPPRFALARAHLATRSLGEAAFQLDRYIALAPRDPNGYLERARVAHQADDRSGLQRIVSRGRAAVPGFPWDRALADLLRAKKR